MVIVFLDSSTCMKMYPFELESNWNEVGYAQDSIQALIQAELQKVLLSPSHETWQGVAPTQVKGHNFFFFICTQVPLELAIALGMEMIDWKYIIIC